MSTHRILIVAPPGAGSLMVALAWPIRFPAWQNSAEQVTATLIAREARLWEGDGLLPERPFRAPHHSVSTAGLVGANGRPGEVSLAHGGRLFLDDVGEFRGASLRALDEALIDGSVRTRRPRDGVVIEYPARPRLVIGYAAPDQVSAAVLQFFRKGAKS